MPSKEIGLKNATIFAAFIFVVWGFYRALFKLPQDAEELVIKPLIWLLPVFYFLNKEKSNFSSVGITYKNLFPSIYSALALGIFLALVGILINFIKYNSINFIDDVGSEPFLKLLLLSFATAVSEEVAFRGYIFNRVLNALGDEWKSNLLVSSVWALTHVPILIFWWKLSFVESMGILLLTFIFGLGSGFVFARTKNIISSILLHVLWAWPIILFR